MGRAVGGLERGGWLRRPGLDRPRRVLRHRRLLGGAARHALAAVALALGLFAQQAAAITFGTVDEKNTYSNVGACVYRAAQSGPNIGKPFVLFSGTLIHPRVLLTAGHCTDLFRQYSDVGINYGLYRISPYQMEKIFEGGSGL